MTHSPGYHTPLNGRPLRSMALLWLSRLSACRKAFPHCSLTISFRLKRAPSGVLAIASSCEAFSKSPEIEAGSFRILPRTCNSGEYPRCRLSVFLVEKQCTRYSLKASSLEMPISSSIDVSMSLMSLPCISVRPSCQCESDAVTLSLMAPSWAIRLNWSET